MSNIVTLVAAHDNQASDKVDSTGFVFHVGGSTPNTFVTQIYNAASKSWDSLGDVYTTSGTWNIGPFEAPVTLRIFISTYDSEKDGSAVLMGV